MTHLTRYDLFSLEEYAVNRNEFRKTVMAHKKHRRVALGPHAHLYFEDRLTIQYQIQEMLRIEKIFEQDGIMEELEAYNPLIPDGANWKATFMLEYPDPEIRKTELAKLIGIEKSVYIQVGDMNKVHPIANEDLDRETEDKTSSVHFLRIELNKDMISTLKDSDTPLYMGVEHPQYSYRITVLPETRAALVKDLV